MCDRKRWIFFNTLRQKDAKINVLRGIKHMNSQLKLWEQFKLKMNWNKLSFCNTISCKLKNQVVTRTIIFNNTKRKQTWGVTNVNFFQWNILNSKQINNTCKYFYHFHETCRKKSTLIFFNVWKYKTIARFKKPYEWRIFS